MAVVTGELANKVALVTGGAGGIGSATARLLASKGAHVVVADLAVERARAVADEINGTAVQLDVTDVNSWKQVPEVDFAHLNAGMMTKADPCALADLTRANWDRIRGINIEGTMNGVLAVVDGMKARGGGSIVVMGSLAGFVGFGDDALYAASKAFVINLARSLAQPLGEAAIRINAVCPGEVETAMLPANRAELLRSKGYRPLSADEVADAVVETMLGGGTGQVLTLVRGRSLEPYEFPGVPKPLRDTPTANS
ncbi:MAG: SDR family NAD(P)-dependent oxidoreductase [Acidimicrobiia bacterium]